MEDEETIIFEISNFEGGKKKTERLDCFFLGNGIPSVFVLFGRAKQATCPVRVDSSRPVVYTPANRQQQGFHNIVRGTATFVSQSRSRGG